jgi:thioredoxin reductase (NADPH)
MITVDDLRAIPLFASVDSAELERLAKVAADLDIPAGENAVNDGDPRALYVVLEGRAEVRKLIAGVYRAVGVRGPGEIFGEVPILLGMRFPAGLRAVVRSRIVRIESRDVHALAAVSPEVSEMLGALVRDRIEGMEELAANEPDPIACVFGARWDEPCYQLRAFLERNLIEFEWVVIGESAPARCAADIETIGDRLPAVRILNGPLLIQPDLRELARRLDLSTEPKEADYDVAIVGGGPAGLAAAVYGASEGLRTVMIESEAPGGQAGTSSRIENYLGFPTGLSGDELSARALLQAKRFGAEIIVTRRVTSIDPKQRAIALDGGDIVRTKTIILATGVVWRRLEIESCDNFVGRGIYYGAARSEAPTAQGKDIYLIGAGNSAGQAALYFSGYARSVTLVVRGDDLSKSMSHYLVQQIGERENIDVLLGCEVVSAAGDDHLESIEILRRANGEKFRRNTSALFAFIGADAETGWLPGEILRDERGYIVTGRDLESNGHWPLKRAPFMLETSAPGIFACGDVRAGSVKRVASGVGEGSMAIAFIHQFLRENAN